VNLAQIKSLSLFALFAIIGFGPISPGCFIGLFIVVVRPAWFLELIQAMYFGLPVNQQSNTQQTGVIRIKAFLSLLGLFIIDIAPVPVTPVIAFIIIISRPAWFYRVVTQVYGES
jgi:hypothetical protein